ncbi:MAG: nitrilase-related carbon-nitrogen hydrolase, partial [Gammaproteobacteria bacterium]
MAYDDLNRVAVAQINACVGDIAQNAKLIIDKIDTARALRADMIIFPEMAISGYPPEDLLLRPGFHQQMQHAVETIAAHCQDIKVILGYTERVNSDLYNACGLLYNGEIIHSYHKRNLPNYGVFDEKRYFTPGNNSNICDIGDKRIALSVCEDLWTPEPAAEAADLGAGLLININASPYHIGKAGIRQQLIRDRARDNKLDILYVNMTGGQDELVFDGDSMLIDKQGKTRFRAPRFVDDVFMLEPADAVIHTPADDEADIYQAIVCGVRDYAHKNHFSGAVIGLSGGIDSALTLAIAVDALGADNIEVLIMPSRYTAEMSNADAEEMADKLGVHHHTYNIEQPFK